MVCYVLYDNYFKIIPHIYIYIVLARNVIIDCVVCLLILDSLTVDTSLIRIALNRCPDGAKVKAKMIYTSSKDSVRKKLVGIGTEVQATDKAEISHDAVLEKVLRK